MNVVSLSRFAADVARSLATTGEKLLEAPDLQERVAGMDTLAVYLAIKELGVGEAVALIRACDKEKRQAFIDLDCWQGDEPNFDELDAWMAPLADAGADALAEGFLGLDGELQVLWLADVLTLYRANEEYIPEPADGFSRKSSPDGYFFIDVLSDSSREVDPFLLVEALYAHSISDGFALLTAVDHELKSYLQEEAFRFRNARMEDLGFPPRADAMGLFAPPQGLAIPPVRADPTTLPIPHARALRENSLFTQALARAPDVELVRLEGEFVHLVNRAVVAGETRPGDLKALMRHAERVRDMLDLGLDALVGATLNLPLATEALTTTPLLEIYRWGHQRLVPLSQAARQLIADPRIAAWQQRPLDTFEDYGEERCAREFLDGLLCRPPCLGGHDPTTPGARIGLRDGNDIDKAEELLAVFPALGFL